MLVGQYVHIRNQVRETLVNKGGSSNAAIPITTRQLEAIVRLSESLAKMRLSAEATMVDVEEALRLFKVSTLAASQSSSAVMAALTNGPGGIPQEIQRAEEFLRRRLAVRMTVSAKKVIEEAQIQGYSNDAIRASIRAMVLRNELEELQQGRILRRLR